MLASVPVLLLPSLVATLLAIATSGSWVARARATMPGDVEGRTKRLHELARRRGRLCVILALVPVFVAMAQGPTTPLDRLLAPCMLGSLLCWELATAPSMRRLHASLRGEKWAARQLGILHRVMVIHTIGTPLAASLGVLAIQSLGLRHDRDGWAFLGHAMGVQLALAITARLLRRIGTTVPLSEPHLDALRAKFETELPTCRVLPLGGEGLWNAVATGIRTKQRRITLSDDLETLLTPAELHAVLCHEVGHHHLRHAHVRTALFVTAYGLLPGAAALLGGLSPNTSAVIPLLCLWPAGRLYRRQERQADAFAARHAPPADLGSALVKMTRAQLLPTDKGTATSHPVLRERILALGLPLEMMAVRAGETPTAASGGGVGLTARPAKAPAPRATAAPPAGSLDRATPPPPQESVTNLPLHRVYDGEPPESPMNAAERPLPERLAAGDARAFAELYDAYVPAIHGWLWARSGRKDLAEDVVQAVMLRCVRHRKDLARVRDLRAWLFAVARNEWRRAGGRDRRAASLDGPAADALPARVSEAPGGEEMRGLVARLRPERREVVVLHAWHGLTFEEIGGVLDTSPNTVASRWRLALEELGHAWKAAGHGRD